MVNLRVKRVVLKVTHRDIQVICEELRRFEFNLFFIEHRDKVGR